MDELRRAEDKLHAMEPGYLQRVRDEVSRLGVRGPGPDLVRDSVRDLEDLVHIDTDVPTYASQRGGKTVKAVIKRSVQWYIRYVAVQVNALGQAMLTFGTAVSDRLDELAESNDNVQERLDDIERRVKRLEANEEKTS
jgi:hypothetical protein